MPLVVIGLGFLEMNYDDLITESAQELLRLERQQRKVKLVDRLRFIRYLKEGVATSQAKAGLLIGLKPRQSQLLWQRYRKSGLDGLLQYNNKGFAGKLNQQQISQLLLHIKVHSGITEKQIQIFLKNQLGVKYTKAGVEHLCRRLKVKLNKLYTDPNR